MGTSVDRVEMAMMAAEHDARRTLLAFDVDVTALVLTFSFNDDDTHLVASSVVPKPAELVLRAALHESAVEAGWTIIDSEAGSP